MTDTSFDEVGDTMVNSEITDESLETAAIAFNLAGRSIGFFCTGLSECPAPLPA